jgi:hypothetical protein
LQLQFSEFGKHFRHENVGGNHGDSQKQKEFLTLSSTEEEEAGNISIFSPKIFSMFPGATSVDKKAHGKNHQILREILSPDLLSLYDDNEEQEEWLNFIIRILGATALLDKLFQQIHQFHSILTRRVTIGRRIGADGIWPSPIGENYGQKAEGIFSRMPKAKFQ